MKPDIELVICTYNNASLLDVALGALEEQRVGTGSWSVLIVDNNCSDDTHSVALRYAERGHLPGLRVVREPLQGLSHARRCGIRETTAPLIAFVDDDCVLASDWVQNTMEMFEAHPRAGVVGGRVTIRYEVPPEPWLIPFGGSLAAQDHGDEPQRMPARGVIRLSGAGLACRRSALQDSGWIEHGFLVGRRGLSLTAGEDVEIVILIRRAGWEAWYTPTLRLEHVIPRRRMSEEYLCRLHQGFGEAGVALHCIVEETTPTAFWRARALVHALRSLLGLCLTAMMGEVVPNRRVSPASRIALHEAFGRVRGAWRLREFPRVMAKER